MNAAHLAYGHARIRARKGRLWTHGDALACLAQPGRLREEPNELFAALVDDYALAMRAYPFARSLLGALWRRHEIENLKLAWRALARALPTERWRPYWRALGALATIGAADVERSASLAAFVAILRSTAYGDVAAAALAEHESDPVAAELAIERWTYASIANEAAALPPREAATASLVRRLVLERDLQRVRRAEAAYGFAPGLAAHLTVHLSDRLRPGAIERIAAWRRGDEPLGARLHRLLDRDARVDGWEALVVVLRLERRRACVRAFTGRPFVLAPVVAYLLLREAEIDARMALASGVAKQAPAALERAFAAALLGA